MLQDKEQMLSRHAILFNKILFVSDLCNKHYLVEKGVCLYSYYYFTEMMCFCISCTNQAECEELQKRVEALGGENRSLREELQKLSEECQKLASENNSIKVYFSYNSSQALPF